MEINYPDLLNPSKYILAELLKNNKPMRWSELKKNLMQEIKSDKTIKMGLDQLMSLELIIKIEEPFNITYRINKKHRQIATILSRKHIDKLSIDSQHISKLINLNTSNSATSIYGLRRNLFYKSNENSRDLEFNKETLQFIQGIKAGELLGKTYATPIPVKMQLKKDASEKEIIEAETAHYLDQLNKTKHPEGIIRLIIQRYRNFPVEFQTLGKGITEKLIDLKKQHRYSQIKDTYETELAKLHNAEIKYILKQFKEEFLKILNNMDVNKYFLERAIFELKGRFMINLTDKRYRQFSKAIEGIVQRDKNTLFRFLLRVYELNKDLWPTSVMFLARST